MNLRNEHARLMAEIQVKQESFVRKERAFTAKIEELENEVKSIRDKRRDWMNSDKNIQELKKYYSFLLPFSSFSNLFLIFTLYISSTECIQKFKRKLG